MCICVSDAQVYLCFCKTSSVTLCVSVFNLQESSLSVAASFTQQPVPKASAGFATWPSVACHAEKTLFLLPFQHTACSYPLGRNVFQS